jgi:hypothetical protein
MVQFNTNRQTRSVASTTTGHRPLASSVAFDSASKVQRRCYDNIDDKSGCLEALDVRHASSVVVGGLCNRSTVGSLSRLPIRAGVRGQSGDRQGLFRSPLVWLVRAGLPLPPLTPVGSAFALGVPGDACCRDPTNCVHAQRLRKRPRTGAVSGHSRWRPFRDYELSTSSAISRKLTVGATPYNPVTLSRSSSVKKASAASCESHT